MDAKTEFNVINTKFATKKLTYAQEENWMDSVMKAYDSAPHGSPEYYRIAVDHFERMREVRHVARDDLH